MILKQALEPQNELAREIRKGAKSVSKMCIDLECLTNVTPKQLYGLLHYSIKVEDYDRKYSELLKAFMACIAMHSLFKEKKARPDVIDEVIKEITEKTRVKSKQIGEITLFHLLFKRLKIWLLFLLIVLPTLFFYFQNSTQISQLFFCLRQQFLGK